MLQKFSLSLNNVLATENIEFLGFISKKYTIFFIFIFICIKNLLENIKSKTFTRKIIEQNINVI